MVGNSISEKMLPPEAQLLVVAGFRYPRRGIVGLSIHKSLKNNILLSTSRSNRALSSKSRTSSQQEPDNRWNDVPRFVRCWSSRSLCGSSLASRRRSSLSPRGIRLYARVCSGTMPFPLAEGHWVIALRLGLSLLADRLRRIASTQYKKEEFMLRVALTSFTVIALVGMTGCATMLQRLFGLS